MNEAVIVSTARTPIGKAYRGAFNATAGVELAAPVLRAVLERAEIEPGEVEELTFGCGYPEGATGGNVARHTAFRAGLPASSAASMVSRFCASGLEAIASAARRVMVDGVPVCVAGGLESISLVQPNANRVHLRNAWLERNKPGVYATMIETADLVATRYGISREAQDLFALESQKRTAAAQAAGLLDDEIVPMTVNEKRPRRER
jgi:acetyl-CoA C-acetyltransferase